MAAEQFGLVANCETITKQAVYTTPWINSIVTFILHHIITQFIFTRYITEDSYLMYSGFKMIPQRWFLKFKGMQ